MSVKFDYSILARRFYATHPVFSSILAQSLFWIVANLFQVITRHLQTIAIYNQLNIHKEIPLLPFLEIAFIMGILYGIPQGIANYYYDKMLFRRRPFGQQIVLRTIFSLLILTTLFFVVRYVLIYVLFSSVLVGITKELNNDQWKLMFFQVMVYYALMTMIISFIGEVSKKFGPGVLLPVLLGKYRHPRVEERIFLFMDLKASTTLAESLGHLKYSAFIRDAFMDINLLLSEYEAEVYQYVGDEIVVIWKNSERLKKLNCVDFFFACERQFEERRRHYRKLYGQIPEFKAGIHIGEVTVVEVGLVKVDIAYHGDTINVAARIQNMCNEYQMKLLTSAEFLNHSSITDNYETKSLGEIFLKGKVKPIELVSITAAN